jgi:acetolactate synthase small subunit
MTSDQLREEVRRFLADIFRVRIVDIEDSELERLAQELRRHELMLIDRSATFS